MKDLEAKTHARAAVRIVGMSVGSAPAIVMKPRRDSYRASRGLTVSSGRLSTAEASSQAEEEVCTRG